MSWEKPRVPWVWGVPSAPVAGTGSGCCWGAPGAWYPLCGCCTWVARGFCCLPLAVSPGPGSPFPLAPSGDGFGAGCFAAVLGWGCLAGVGAAGARLNPSQQVLSWQMKRFVGLARRKSAASGLRMLSPPEQNWRDVLATQCADLGFPHENGWGKNKQGLGDVPWHPWAWPRGDVVELGPTGRSRRARLRGMEPTPVWW